MGDPVCTFPTPTGAATLRLVVSPYSWLNHPLYQIQTYPGSGTPTVTFTQNQMDYIAGLHSNFFTIQQFLENLPQDNYGNYCLTIGGTIGDMNLYNPVPAVGMCGGLKKVTIIESAWNNVLAAFNDMDCANTYIRNNFN